MPNQLGNMIKYNEFMDNEIAVLLKNNNIKSLNDYLSNGNSEVFSKKIIERLFVKYFLKSV